MGETQRKPMLLRRGKKSAAKRHRSQCQHPRDHDLTRASIGIVIVIARGQTVTFRSFVSFKRSHCHERHRCSAQHSKYIADCATDARAFVIPGHLLKGERALEQNH
jgi:hypothetical protein